MLFQNCLLMLLFWMRSHFQTVLTFIYGPYLLNNFWKFFLFIGDIVVGFLSYCTGWLCYQVMLTSRTEPGRATSLQLFGSVCIEPLLSFFFSLKFPCNSPAVQCGSGIFLREMARSYKFTLRDIRILRIPYYLESFCHICCLSQNL